MAHILNLLNCVSVCCTPRGWPRFIITSDTGLLEECRLLGAQMHAAGVCESKGVRGFLYRAVSRYKDASSGCSQGRLAIKERHDYASWVLQLLCTSLAMAMLFLDILTRRGEAGFSI